ncbi:hypothetical protein ABIF81_002071 [Bradyrhizobium daqingense]
MPGMNCAIPCACSPLRVIGPTASAWKRLSCQITRAKNSSGKSLSRAAASTIKQIDSRVSLSRASFGFSAGFAGSSAAFAGASAGGVSSASADDSTRAWHRTAINRAIRMAST